MSKPFHWVILFGVSAIWGVAFPVIKFLLGYVSPYDLLILRFVPTSIITLICILLFFRKEVAALIPKHWWVFLSLAAAWVIFYHLMLNIGETVLPAGAAGLIIATYPVFTVIITAMFGTEKLTRAKIMGGCVAFAGTAVLTILGATQEAKLIDVTPMEWVRYSLITLVAPITSAITTLVTRRYLAGDSKGDGKIDSFVMTLTYMTPAGFLALLFLLSPQNDLPARLSTLPPGFWIALTVLVLFCTIIAHFGWFWALQRVEAGPVAITTYSIPIFSLTYARIWLGEPINLASIIGATGIIAGLLISGLGENKTPPESPPKSGTGSKKFTTRTS